MFKKLGIVSLVLATGCAQQNSLESQSQVKAPSQITSSFKVESTEPSALSLDKAKIVINKSSLEKEFLLQASLILQADVALGSGLKSRVVAFRQRGDQLYMMEATQGHTLSTDTPQNFVLAAFPITAETETTLTFDFNTGMKDVYLLGDWGASDDSGTAYDASGHFFSMEARKAFIDSAAINDKNQLVISQVSQISFNQFGQFFNFPSEVRYYLSPYQTNPAFTAMKTPGFDRMGFFEVAPQHTLNGSDVTYVSKWDISQKPIVFAVSANTPAEYRQAVKEGALYWNKAFGSEVIQVVDGQPGVTAPDINANIIQWVNWDDAGFAYADAQMDPRNGEIRHAQVYFTSAFAFNSKDRARALLRLLSTPATRHEHASDEMDEQADATLPQITSQKDLAAVRRAASKQSESKMDQIINARLALKGLRVASMSQSGMCNRHFTSHMAQSLENMLAEDPSDAQILKMSQDYVREVVAHEIGHTLGLRHNFAGSQAANYSLASRPQITRQYMLSGAAPQGIITSSSVMEYQVFEEAAITGDQIVREPTALSYDQKAIEALYKGKKFAFNETPTFCTDTHAEVYFDCMRFDYGSSFIEYGMNSVNEGLKAIPARIFERFVSAKTPGAGADATPIELVGLPRADKFAAEVITARYLTYLQFTKAGNSVKIRRGFPVANALFADKIRKAELDYLDSEVARLGGSERVFEDVSVDFAKNAQQQFMLLASLYQEGKGRGGKDYLFTAQELQVMAFMSEEYFKQVQKWLLHFDINILNGTFDGNPLVDHTATEKLADVLKSRMRKVLFANDPADVILATYEIPMLMSPEIKMNINARLPKFKYDHALRTVTAGYLRSSRSPSIEKLDADKKQIQNDFKAFLTATVGSDISTIDTLKLKFTKEATKWVNDNKSVLSSIQ